MDSKLVVRVEKSTKAEGNLGYYKVEAIIEEVCPKEQVNERIKEIYKYHSEYK